MVILTPFCHRAASRVLEAVLGLMRCFAVGARDGTWFDDHVKVMLVSDSARLAWLQSKDGPLRAERQGSVTDAQRRADAARRAALAKRNRAKKMRRLDDGLWGKVCQYEIAVKTSDKRGAGTDANVHVVLYGTDADSGEIPLFVAGDSGDKFERDALDVFIVNSLWIVTSDHGELFFEKGLVTHGRTLYEAEARVPLLLHWPDGIEPEERTEPVSHLDIMPTVLQLLGLPAHPAFQGRSFALANAARGEEDPKAVFMNIQGLRFADAIVCWPYKLILDRTGETQLLFDLARDPAESSNIIEQRPEITTRLADSLKRQLLAQLDYHSENAVDLRRRRYQPRLLRCPRFPKN